MLGSHPPFLPDRGEINASLVGADLGGAGLEGANLGFAGLEGADLGFARLEGADLGFAGLEGANLGFARLEGADLRNADFRNSDWAGASNRASPAQSADFRGAQELVQDQLENVIGNIDTLLPDYPDPNGEEYAVWSCWEFPPAGFDDLVARALDFGIGTRADLLDDWLCGREPPLRTGTHLAADAAYPPGHALSNRE